MKLIVEGLPSHNRNLINIEKEEHLHADIRISRETI